jgi:TatD DNase family protein
MHCHLDLYANPRQLLLDLKRVNAYVLSVTTTPKAWAGTRAMAAGYPRIKTALGLHPQLAHERIGELPLFERLLPDARYVGEIGLDGSPEFAAHWRDQVTVFEHVLASSASAGGRILSIHSRAAATEVLDAIERHPGAGTAILHWFSGNSAQLDRAIKIGCWFSVGAAMLKSKKGRQLVERMPRERVLTETDGPFGTLNGSVLQPADTTYAVDTLSSLWDQTKMATARSILDSLARLVTAYP